MFPSTISLSKSFIQGDSILRTSTNHSFDSFQLLALIQHTAITKAFKMTRSHKYNDRDHAALADGSATAHEHLPRYFAKHGHEGVDPKKVKKNGAGKCNWGNAGEEVIDQDFHFTNARRRTNSSGFADNIQAFKTKFDVNEPEPVFEESVHGPNEEDGEDLTKIETSESGHSSSYGDDKHTKH